MITYDAGRTERAVEFFENNLDFLGKVQSIKHEVLNHRPFYKTTIEGSEETLVINNVLASGFSGEGGPTKVWFAEPCNQRTRKSPILWGSFSFAFILGLQSVKVHIVLETTCILLPTNCPHHFIVP